MARAILLAVALAAAGAAPLALAQSQSNVPIWDTPPPPAEPATPPAAQPATTPPPAATPAPAFPLPPSQRQRGSYAVARGDARASIGLHHHTVSLPRARDDASARSCPRSNVGIGLRHVVPAGLSSGSGAARSNARRGPSAGHPVPAHLGPAPTDAHRAAPGLPGYQPSHDESDETTPWYKPTDADGDLAWNRIDPWEHASSFSVEGFWGSGASDYLLEYESIHGGMFSFFVGEASTPTDLFIQVGYLVGVGFQFVAPIRIYDFKQPDIQLGLILPEWRIGLILDPNTKFYGLWTSLVLVGLRATFFDIVKLEVKLLQPGAYMEGDFSNVAPNPQLTLGLSAGLGAGADLGIVF